MRLAPVPAPDVPAVAKPPQFPLKLAEALRRTFAAGYGKADLRADLLAGAVVGVVALPLSMALAVLPGPFHLAPAIEFGSQVIASNQKIMPTKKTAKKTVDDLRPEYDFATLRKSVRGKYFERARAESNIAVLDPDVAKAFPTSEAVNTALRLLADVAAESARPARKRRSKAA